MLSKCRFDGAEGAEDREECLGVDGVAFQFLFVQGGAEGTDERVLVRAHDALSCAG